MNTAMLIVAVVLAADQPIDEAVRITPGTRLVLQKRLTRDWDSIVWPSGIEIRLEPFTWQIKGSRNSRNEGQYEYLDSVHHALYSCCDPTLQGDFKGTFRYIADRYGCDVGKSFTVVKTYNASSDPGSYILGVVLADRDSFRYRVILPALGIDTASRGEVESLFRVFPALKLSVPDKSIASPTDTPARETNTRRLGGY